MNYHFEMPGIVIWLFHIIGGLLLAMIGFQSLNNRSMSQLVALSLIVTGIMAAVYHGHIWFVKRKENNKN